MRVKQILKNSEGIIFVKDSKYGAISKEGTITIPNEYEGLKQIDNGYFIAKKDGKFGVITEKAVIDYQKKNQLEADGEVGIMTWKKLLGVKK